MAVFAQSKTVCTDSATSTIILTQIQGGMSVCVQMATSQPMKRKLVPIKSLPGRVSWETNLTEGDRCYWCDLGFNLDIDYRGASDKAACASVGVVVAPLPQSVLDQQSSRNVTWFGSTTSKSLTVPTSGTTAPGNMSTTAPITAAITRSAPTSTTTIRIPDQNTWYGGVTSARTLDGGASAFTTTPTATSLTPDLSAVAAQITTANGDNRLTPISIVVLMLVLFVGVLLM